MDERSGPMTKERVGLHKADCRAAGGWLTIPCDKGRLEMTGPHPKWSFTLDGSEISEADVENLTQTDFAR